MIRRRARFFADRCHRFADGEAHDVFGGDRAAVDDRQTGGDAPSLDPLAVITAEARRARNRG